MKTIALIVAGGKSTRFGGDVPKQFRRAAGHPLLSWTISRFQKATSIEQIVVVVPEEYLIYTTQNIIDPYKFSKVVKIIAGGETRSESVFNGLKALPLSTNFVAIHDGARPLVTCVDIDRVVNEAIKERAAIIAVRATDTVKRVQSGYIITTLQRDLLYLAQTPQVFQYDLIIEAHKYLAENAAASATVTDDASLIEERGFKVRVVEPTSPNFKVTTAADLHLAESLLKGENLE